MTKPTKMTELEAVNVLLTTIGEAPVNTLTGNQVTDVTIAMQVLNEVSREIQSQGWYFNTENGVKLNPDNNKHILPPADTARIDSKDYNIVIREEKLFDLDDFSYEFGGTIKVNIVYYQDFTVLPDSAKRYIAARAARIYSDRMLNSETIHAMTLRDERQALVDLRQFEEETADYTMMDSYAVSRITNRGFKRRIL
jgi:hypothetical protein